jgi:hypothetical protein
MLDQEQFATRGCLYLYRAIELHANIARSAFHEHLQFPRF